MGIVELAGRGSLFRPRGFRWLALLLVLTAGSAGCEEAQCPTDHQYIDGRCLGAGAVGIGPDGCVLFRYHPDADGDGYGDATQWVDACDAPEGYVQNGDDCNDDCNVCWTGADEVCDGRDNDCNGAVDEATERSCGQSAGACQAGVQHCIRGIYGPCQGSVRPTFDEICGNGTDDDCDGLVDEGCSCQPGEVGSCGTSVGRCELGERTCTEAGMFGPCSSAAMPEAESCNGIDDDCDGRVDEHNPGSGGSCGEGLGACAGVESCEAGALLCAERARPVTEVCNGVDDDCDGIIDEHVRTTFYRDADLDGFGDPNDALEACVMPDGYVELAGDCDDDCATCHPGQVEVCDGRDNDCSEGPDSAFECTQGVPAPCMTECGSIGTATCSELCEVVSECLPPEETCNGVDDDCDGQVDEGVRRPIWSSAPGLPSTLHFASAQTHGEQMIVSATANSAVVEWMTTRGLPRPEASVSWRLAQNTPIAVTSMSPEEALVGSVRTAGGSCSGDGVGFCIDIRFVRMNYGGLEVVDTISIPVQHQPTVIRLAYRQGRGAVAWSRSPANRDISASSFIRQGARLYLLSAPRVLALAPLMHQFDIAASPDRQDRMFLAVGQREGGSDQVYLGTFDPTRMTTGTGVVVRSLSAVAKGSDPQIAPAEDNLILAYYGDSGPAYVRLDSEGRCPSGGNLAACPAFGFPGTPAIRYLQATLMLATFREYVALAAIDNANGRRLVVGVFNGEDRLYETFSPPNATDVRLSSPMVSMLHDGTLIFGSARSNSRPAVYYTGCTPF